VSYRNTTHGVIALLGPGRPGSSIRVVVADDHFVFRSGLRAMVEDAEDLDFIGAAGDDLADRLTALAAGPTRPPRLPVPELSRRERDVLELRRRVD
jgi:hypothetical protein